MMHVRNVTSGAIGHFLCLRYDSTLGLEITFRLYNLHFHGCLLRINHVNRAGVLSFGPVVQ